MRLPRLCTAALALTAIAVTAGPAAAVTSDWVTKAGGRMRLISAELPGTTGKTKRVVGIQVELEPGWKTYWRSPGDGGGVPPTVTWEDSGNIGRGVMHYPAPERFKDANGDSVGYHDGVVFVLEVTPANPVEPIEFKAGLFIGVCKEICVPVEAELGFTLKRGEPADPAVAALLQRALAAEPLKEDAAGQDLPRIGAVTGEVKGKAAAMQVEVTFPPGATKTDVFVEAAEGAYVPLPAATEPDASGKAVFRIDLSKTREAKSLASQDLVITAVSSAGAVEARRRLNK
jgi:DsbC/DsbD-like thiol-disulfide interchange protein